MANVNANVLVSLHPEPMDGTSAVFIWETTNFSQGQGNQGLARRRVPYLAQARAQIEAEIVEKGRYRMKTS